jgi:hypothetical protein
MNYAYNSANSGGFSGLNLDAWLRSIAGLNTFQQGMFDTNPDAAMQQFIDTSKPSNTNEDTLRRMLKSMQDQWLNSQILHPTQSTSFTDFMSKYDYNQNMARLGPDQRHENPSAFNRPVRTVTF